MTFDAYETSPALGEPIFLYRFSVGTTLWLYTSADRPIVVSADSYEPIAISCGNIVQGQEIRQKTLKVTVPRSALLIQKLQGFPPSTDLMLTVFAIHYDDPDAQAIVAWIGRVKSQNQKASVVELSCEPAYTGIQTAGLRRRWQINCPHVLYAVGTCNVAPSSFVVPGTITSVGSNGFTLTSADFVPPTGLSFAGGYIEWPSADGYLERRTVNSFDPAGPTLTLAWSSTDLVPGLLINVFPGCDHTSDNCTSFGAILDYGGALYIPLKNPFDGNPVY